MDNKNTPAALDEEPEIIVLTDEDGVSEEFELLDIIELRGSDYAVLLPTGDVPPEEEDVAVILEIIEELDSDEDTYAGIEDTALVDEIYGIFMDRHRDEFNFISDDGTGPKE